MISVVKAYTISVMFISIMILLEALRILRLVQTHAFGGQQKNAVPGPDTLWMHFVLTSLS